MPDIESHIDTVDGANFITVCDVQSAYWKIPTAKKDCHKTAFVTSKGKYVFKVLPFGIANAPWIFQRVVSLAFANFGQPSGLLVYMDDVIACSATCEAHPRLVGITFWSRTVMRLSNRVSRPWRYASHHLLVAYYTPAQLLLTKHKGAAFPHNVFLGASKRRARRRILLQRDRHSPSTAVPGAQR